jgi:hypothetical protein
VSATLVQQSAVAGSTSVQVTATAECGYVASTAAPWITLAGDTGVASATLMLQLTANASRLARSSTVQVNERTIAVTQFGIYGPDADGDGLPDGFETLFGVSEPAADADGDGVTNLREFEQGTDPTLPNVWNLSEGATGFFAERLALANPGIEDAEFSVRFLREGSAPIDRSYVLPGQRRLTIDVNAIDGLANEAVSAVVTTTRGGVVVERTMRWDARDGTFYGGHTGKAITAPRTQWYLAEGEARFFDTYILLANPGTTAAQVTAQYLLESGTTVTRQYTVNPQARVTVYANAIHGVTGNAFSTDVKSDVPIAVERAMYFSTSGRFWNGGHEVAAVAAPATEWFVAEGRTGPFFDMYLLLANPGTASVSTTIRFLKPDGSVVTATRTLAATSRTTIHVDGIAGLADTDVSAAITATGPIIVERAMYWPDPFVSGMRRTRARG